MFGQGGASLRRAPQASTRAEGASTLAIAFASDAALARATALATCRSC